MGAIANGNGDPLFTIIRDSDLELVVDVSESDITKITLGHKAFDFAFRQPRKLTGSVRLVVADRRCGHPPRGGAHLHR